MILKSIEAIDCFDKVLNIIKDDNIVNKEENNAQKEHQKIIYSYSHLYRGQCEYMLVNYSKAFADFGNIKNLQQDKHLNVEIHNNLGLCLYQQNLFKEAEDEYKKALDLSSKLDSSDKEIQAHIYYNLAVLYNKQDKLDLAKSMFESSLNMDSNFIKSKESLNKLESQRPTNWYDWWFNGINDFKMLYLKLRPETEENQKNKLKSIRKLEIKDSLRIFFGLLVLVSISIGIVQLGLNSIFNPDKIPTIIFAISILMAILVSPNLKNFSLGKDTVNVQLDTEPPNIRHDMQAEPIIPILKPFMPALIYPIEQFIVPYYQDPLLLSRKRTQGKIFQDI